MAKVQMAKVQMAKVCRVPRIWYSGAMKGCGRDACSSAVQAREFYSKFVERVGREYSQEKVKDGVFGAMMAVNLVNDVRLSSSHSCQPPSSVYIIAYCLYCYLGVTGCQPCQRRVPFLL